MSDQNHVIINPATPVTPPVPAPPPAPAVTETDPVKLARTLKLAHRLLEGAAKLTTDFELDDKFVVFLAQFVDELWFAELIADFIDMFKKGGVSRDGKVDKARFVAVLNQTVAKYKK